MHKGGFKEVAMKTVMIIGVGGVGGYVLEFLARRMDVDRIVLADIHGEVVKRKAHLALAGAICMGSHPRIESYQLDLLDVEKTADLLCKVEPDVILNTASLQTWWEPRQLRDDILAQLGPRKVDISLHLTLCHGLMEAQRESKKKIPVINGAYGDAVNPILGRVGLAPTCGIGNIDHTVELMRSYISQNFCVHPGDINILMVAHHAIIFHALSQGTIADLPFYCSISIDGINVTEKIPPEKIFKEILGSIPLGKDLDALVASSAVKNLLAILNDINCLTHSPGPLGLVGGYPIRLGQRGAEIIVPPDLTLEECIAINEKGQKFDGIERIEEDGRLVYTQEAEEGFSRVYGLPSHSFSIEESRDRAFSILERFKDLPKREQL